jgi:hypothetical protein
MKARQMCYYYAKLLEGNTASRTFQELDRIQARGAMMIEEAILLLLLLLLDLSYIICNDLWIRNK